MNFLFFVGKHILLILSAFTACEILISIYDVWIVHWLNFLTFIYRSFENINYISMYITKCSIREHSGLVVEYLTHG